MKSIVLVGLLGLIAVAGMPVAERVADNIQTADAGSEPLNDRVPMPERELETTQDLDHDLQLHGQTQQGDEDEETTQGGAQETSYYWTSRSHTCPVGTPPPYWTAAQYMHRGHRGDVPIRAV